MAPSRHREKQSMRRVCSQVFARWATFRMDVNSWSARPIVASCGRITCPKPHDWSSSYNSSSSSKTRNGIGSHRPLPITGRASPSIMTIGNFRSSANCRILSSPSLIIRLNLQRNFLNMVFSLLDLSDSVLVGSNLPPGRGIHSATSADIALDALEVLVAVKCKNRQLTAAALAAWCQVD